VLYKYFSRKIENMSKEQIFEKYWKKTEIIREYHQVLFTFGDMRLPYVFLAEHSSYSDRTLVNKGVVNIQKPNIVLPGFHKNIEFKEGFDKFHDLPPDMTLVMRSLGLPNSEISNKEMVREEIEYGGLQEVIDKYSRKLESNEDSDTALIKGVVGGVEISLMRYSIGLMVKSGPANVKEFIEHMRRQTGEPIRSDEKITDEDIRKLFG
jgi:hypothetical protein